MMESPVDALFLVVKVVFGCALSGLGSGVWGAPVCFVLVGCCFGSCFVVGVGWVY